MNPNLWICAGLVAIGIAFHFVTKLGELESVGKIVSPWGYWKQHPYTSLTVVMAAYLFMAVQHSIGELTHTSALLTGVACNSAGVNLRSKAASMLNRGNKDGQQ